MFNNLIRAEKQNLDYAVNLDHPVFTGLLMHYSDFSFYYIIIFIKNLEFTTVFFSGVIYL